MHQQPASLKIAALLHKPEATIHPIAIDYLAFSIPDKFVVGYGLDYDGLGRNLKEILPVGVEIFYLLTFLKYILYFLEKNKPDIDSFCQFAHQFIASNFIFGEK